MSTYRYMYVFMGKILKSSESGLGKTEFLSVPDQNSEIGTDWKQPKAQKNQSHTGPILRKFSPILSDI